MKVSLTGSKPAGLSVIAGYTRMIFSAKSQVSGVDTNATVADLRVSDLLLRAEQYLYQEDGYNSFFRLGADGKSLMEFHGMQLDPVDFQQVVLSLFSQELVTNDPRITFMMRFEAKKFNFPVHDPRCDFVALLQKLELKGLSDGTRRFVNKKVENEQN